MYFFLFYKNRISASTFSCFSHLVEHQVSWQNFLSCSSWLLGKGVSYVIHPFPHTMLLIPIGSSTTITNRAMLQEYLSYISLSTGNFLSMDQIPKSRIVQLKSKNIFEFMSCFLATLWQDVLMHPPGTLRVVSSCPTYQPARDVSLLPEEARLVWKDRQLRLCTDSPWPVLQRIFSWVYSICRDFCIPCFLFL